MGSDRYKEWLDQYWEGSLDEQKEAELKSFMLSPDGKKAFPSQSTLFTHFERAKSVEAPISDREILEQTVYKNKSSTQINTWQFMKWAAAILIIATAAFLLYRDMESNQDELKEKMAVDTFEDPKRAFEEAKKALLLVSSNITKGRSAASKLNEFHEAESTIKEELEEESKIQ